MFDTWTRLLRAPLCYQLRKSYFMDEQFPTIRPSIQCTATQLTKSTTGLFDKQVVCRSSTTLCFCFFKEIYCVQLNTRFLGGRCEQPIMQRPTLRLAGSNAYVDISLRAYHFGL
jgi:hypothetical protein